MDADQPAQGASDGGSAAGQGSKAMLPPPARKPMAPPPKFGEPKPGGAAGEDAEARPQPGSGPAGEATAPSGAAPAANVAPEPNQLGAEAAAAARANRAGVAAAAAAAAQAAAHATPAQRERIILEAAAGAMAAQRERQEAAAAAAPAGDGPAEPAAPKPAGSYAPPAWAGPPEGFEYGLEVLKGGAVLGQVGLVGKDHFTFGRTPANDVVLDHPSTSRLHAVVQFRGEDGAAFLFDPGSTHGVYANKRRVPAGKYVPLRVGDVLRFGESTRLYVLTGPEELMPEEGPSREQRQQAAALEAMAARREREAALAKAQMDRALAGGASWGFGEDAEEVEDPAGGAVDWRAYAATHGLSERQQKTADKLRRLELKIGNLQAEIGKIKAKQTPMDDLTPGQMSTMVRNEREIERATAEMEELEEVLEDSVRDSIGAKKRAAEGAGGGEGKKKKKRRRPDSDDDYGSSDDDMYDRTAKAGGAKGGRRGGAGGGAGGGAKAREVEDAASLYGKRGALTEERARLAEALAKEEAAAAAAAAAAAGPGSDGAAAAAAEGATGSSGAGSGASGAGDDSLDAFMTGVAASLESDRAAGLRRDLADVDAQLARAERLLKIADPEGYYNDGSAAAAAAVAKARRGLEVEKARRAAEAKQRAEREAARQAEAAAAGLAPEEEEEAGAEGADGLSVAAQAAASVHRLEASAPAASGLQLRQRPAAAPPPEPQQGQQAAAQQAPKGGEAAGVSSYQARRAGIAAALAEAQKGAGPSAGGASHQPGNKDVHASAAAKVMADLALLSQARRGAVAAEEEAAAGGAGGEAGAGAGAAAAGEWRPPEGQKGDGRTSLNDALGY